MFFFFQAFRPQPLPPPARLGGSSETIAARSRSVRRCRQQCCSSPPRWRSWLPTPAPPLRVERCSSCSAEHHLQRDSNPAHLHIFRKWDHPRQPARSQQPRSSSKCQGCCRCRCGCAPLSAVSEGCRSRSADGRIDSSQQRKHRCAAPAKVECRCEFPAAGGKCCSARTNAATLQLCGQAAFGQQ